MSTTPDTPPGDTAGARAPRRRDARDLLRQLTGTSGLITALAVVLALLVGAVLIIATDTQFRVAVAYFFARPGDTFLAVGESVGQAYALLMQGGLYDYTQPSFADGIKPLFNALGFATPLIAAGLGIGIGFRAGVFNIGGQGQMLAGGTLGGWVGFALPMPPGVHLVVAVAAGVLGGLVLAAVAGLLKALTGAHEVIVTIMLNYIAYYFVGYLLKTSVLQAPGSNNPVSPPMEPTAVFPRLLGADYSLNLGFVLVVLLTVLASWLLNRSSLGFRLRAVGQSPRAARVAGIGVGRVAVLTMVISGALVGFAGVYQVLGQTTTGFTNALDAGIGFSAITVALLGRNRPWGIFWAGILFGIFQAGGYAMQAGRGVDINIVAILQATIVLFIAAPPLVRAVFRLSDPRGGSVRPSKPRRGDVPTQQPTAPITRTTTNGPGRS